MTDYLTPTIILLAAAALFLPLLQLRRIRPPNLPGYILAAVLGVSMVLLGLSTFYPSTVPWAGTLLRPDQLGGIFALVTVGVTLAVTVASFDLQKGPSNPIYNSLLALTAQGMVLHA